MNDRLRTCLYDMALCLVGLAFDAAKLEGLLVIPLFREGLPLLNETVSITVPEINGRLARVVRPGPSIAVEVHNNSESAKNLK